MRKWLIGLALTVALGAGVAPAPAAAEAPAMTAAVAQTSVQAADVAHSKRLCIGSAVGNSLTIWDNFQCLGDFFQLSPLPVINTCYPYIHEWTTTFHPPPNGFGNAISSVRNGGPMRLQFYDANNCGGPVLFAMDPYTFRASLNTIANNKASSMRTVVVG